MKRIIYPVIFLMALGCKARQENNSQKSITDSKGRVFGLLPIPAQGQKPKSFAFRLCNIAIHRSTIDQAMNDRRICVNPYIDANGREVTIEGEDFTSMEAAETKLRTRGYTKGAAVAVPGAIGGVLVGYIGGAFLALPYASAGMFTSATTANMLVIGGTSAGGAAGGLLGYSIWGANDRETANRVSAILEDFRKETKTDNVVPILKTFGGAMGWRITADVDSF